MRHPNRLFSASSHFKLPKFSFMWLQIFRSELKADLLHIQYQLLKWTMNHACFELSSSGSIVKPYPLKQIGPYFANKPIHFFYDFDFSIYSCSWVWMLMELKTWMPCLFLRVTTCWIFVFKCRLSVSLFMSIPNSPHSLQSFSS